MKEVITYERKINKSSLFRNIGEFFYVKRVEECDDVAVYSVTTSEISEQEYYSSPEGKEELIMKRFSQNNPIHK